MGRRSILELLIFISGNVLPSQFKVTSLGIMFDKDSSFMTKFRPDSLDSEFVHR